MEISLITNPVAGGWHPGDMQRFLGGNEESVVLLSRALAKAGHSVDVHTTLRGAEFVDSAGVFWRQRESFNESEATDVLISWKDRNVWLNPIGARHKIYASQDIEPPLAPGAMNQIDRFITLASYHTERLDWIPPHRRTVIPLGVDPAEYTPSGEKEHLAIYATSPDRGLETLLHDWKKIRLAHDNLRLIITYDWSRLERMSGPSGAAYARKLDKLSEQPGIEKQCFDADGIKKAFQRAKYYIHPLIRLESDLFGFGAMKAQACGCKLVLNTLESGFRDMAREWIPYGEFMAGHTEPEANPRFCLEPMDWDAIVAKYWQPLFDEMEVSSAA
jgi:glycosyltransferase involved in cell wall biosynthesis